MALLSAIFSSRASSKANKKAVAAQTAATNANLALQRENRDLVVQQQQPFLQGGYGGFDQLLRELGVQPQQGAAPATGGAAVARPPGGYAGGVPAQPQGGIDGQAYWDANPDLAADQSLSGFNPGDLTGDGAVDNADRGAWHYQNYGQNEGRPAPQVAPDPVDPNAAPDLMNARRPDMGPPPTPQRGPDFQMQDFGQAPDAASYYANFEADPGAAYRRSEALSGVNAYSAARGKLRSGDAAKALATLASDLGSQEYGNWFARQTQRLAADRGQFNANRSDSRNLYSYQNNRGDANFVSDRGNVQDLWTFQNNRNDNNFDTDRQFQTNRLDNRVNNLFRVANYGQNAAGAVGNATTNFSNNATNINQNQADVIGQAAINRANNKRNLYGSIEGSAASAARLFAGGGF